MKTFLPFRHPLLLMVIFFLVTVTRVFAQAPSSAELKFENVSLYSGTAGANGAVYLFPDVNYTTDALVKITGRSSALVTLSSIDLTNTGFGKAFQPNVSYDGGNVNGAASWWMEFEIKFVHKNTGNPVTLDTVYATGLDIDGDNDNLREFNSFYSSNSFALEKNTLLSVSSVTGTIAQPGIAGNKFTGTTIEHPGVDTAARELMTTHFFANLNTMTVRVGASTSSSSNSTNRMHSIWFKNFIYASPNIVLPLKLTSFTALCNNASQVELKWTTPSETNPGYFIVERSLDGKNFNNTATVPASGNTSTGGAYTFVDNVKGLQPGIIYYRLRSTDADGKYQYSDIRVIRISGQPENAVTIQTYPNPVNNELHITLPVNWQNKKVVYELFNSQARPVRKLEAIAGNQTEMMNVSNLGSGIYFLKVTCEGHTVQQKILK